MTILEPMPPERFDEFAAVSSASHAADHVASGRWLEQGSVARARAELKGFLPQRAATPDHRFYEIKSAPAGEVLGFLWLGSIPRGGARVAFVFQVFVYPEHRRRGHARAALLEAEALAAAMGPGGIALNVSGNNAAALELYRSLGYVATSLSMHKPLSARRVE